MKFELKNIRSKNLGIIEENGHFSICYIECDGENDNIIYAFAINEGKKVDPNNVTKINDMFYKMEVIDDDKDYYCTIERLNKNYNCAIYSKIKSKNTINSLLYLSIFEQTIDWHTEDEGDFIVNTNEEKEISFRKILKVENVINKLEKAARKKNKEVYSY